MLRIVLIACFFTGIFSVIVTPSYAQVADRYATCDECGLCQLAGTPLPTPQSYEQCKKCLYPQAQGLDSLKIGTDGSGLPPSPYQGNMYTMLGCLRTDAGEFTVQLSRLFFNIVGGIAFLFLLYGAGVIAASRANTERLMYGRKVVVAAIAGLLFVLASTFIIRFVATEILQIPGF